MYVLHRVLRVYGTLSGYIESSVRIQLNAVTNPFRTAVSFSGQLGKNYLEFEWIVPKTGLEL